MGTAIFDNRISSNFVWFSTVLYTLKEEKQDSTHIFLSQKRANETGNLTPLSIIRLSYFNYGLFRLKVMCLNVHCETPPLLLIAIHILLINTLLKTLFVLASRQKIPVLRTENPAVDTRTICLPPVEFFKIPHARKGTARKSQPKTTDTAGKSRPSGPWRETFYVPMPKKLRPENPSKQLQIPPDNPAASNSRNGRKIPAFNCS